MKSLKLPKEIEPLLKAAESAAEDTLVFTYRKRPVAALVSLRHVDRESLALSMNRDFLTIINKARREIRAGRRFHWKRLSGNLQELGLTGASSRPAAKGGGRLMPGALDGRTGPSDMSSGIPSGSMIGCGGAKR